MFHRYDITPYPDFNFGQVRVDTITSGTLLLKNNGNFPLSYAIAWKSHPQVQKIEDSNNKYLKPSATSKEKDKDDKGKKALLVLSFDPFEISPTNGVIGVGEAETITITSKPSEVKAYEEIVVFTFSENPSLLQKKNELVISAEGCLPSVDFSNFKSIFREHFVCKTEAEFVCPTKVDKTFSQLRTFLGSSLYTFF